MRVKLLRRSRSVSMREKIATKISSSSNEWKPLGEAPLYEGRRLDCLTAIALSVSPNREDCDPLTDSADWTHRVITSHAGIVRASRLLLGEDRLFDLVLFISSPKERRVARWQYAK